MGEKESKALVDSLNEGTCWVNLRCKEAAKAAAQDDYERRILSALTPDDAMAAREVRDKQVREEALRGLLDIRWTCFHNLETEVDVVSVHDILALIPDQHKDT